MSPPDPAPPPLHVTERDTYVVPIRHHSPACSAHLERLLEEVKPAAVLVEGPCDFDPHIPLLNDERTRAPVAIVAIRSADDESGAKRATSYFPFCSHSPEFIALRCGVSASVPTRFIDLPSQSRALIGEGAESPMPNMLGDEASFDSGDFVSALVREMGCRDGNEVWDQLFESQIGHDDWRGFFSEVGPLLRLHARSDVGRSIGGGRQPCARSADARGHCASPQGGRRPDCGAGRRIPRARSGGRPAKG